MLAEEPRFTIVERWSRLKRILESPGLMTKNLARTPFLMKNGVPQSEDPSIAEHVRLDKHRVVGTKE
jgi:hypothetical protein